MSSSSSTAKKMFIRTSLGISATFASLVFGQQQQQQLPEFFTSELKDEYGELESMDKSYSEEACSKRTSMLKTMSTIANPQIGNFKAQVLEDLGMCETKNENYKQAVVRFQSAIHELEMVTHRSETDFLKIPQLQFYAPMVFNKQMATALNKGDWGEATMSFRRTKGVYGRQMDKEVLLLL